MTTAQNIKTTTDDAVVVFVFNTSKLLPGLAFAPYTFPGTLFKVFTRSIKNKKTFN